MKSIENRCNDLFKMAFWICYEDNPCRVGWELHSNNSDVVITRSEDIKPNEYYLIDVYMDGENIDKLYDITEGFVLWIDTYKSGRTSIFNMLNLYTPEKLEELLQKYESNIKVIVALRDNFVKKQKSNKKVLI
jgi:hypothetical protein